MKNKVTYPAFAEIWPSTETGTEHLGFPFSKEAEFEAWCDQNNFGYEATSVAGIVRSHCHIFWDAGQCPVEFVQESA